MTALERRLIRFALACAFAGVCFLACVAYAPGGGGGGGGNSWRIPRGSYRQTCEGIRVDGYRLKASCRTSRGSWRRSSLDLRGCHDDIVNQDGYLRCADEGGQIGRLPGGSYIRSCTDIRVRKKRLEAECRSDEHRWRHSSIAVRECRRFRNDDGRLACE